MKGLRLYLPMLWLLIKQALLLSTIDCNKFVKVWNIFVMLSIIIMKSGYNTVLFVMFIYYKSVGIFSFLSVAVNIKPIPRYTSDIFLYTQHFSPLLCALCSDAVEFCAVMEFVPAEMKVIGIPPPGNARSVYGNLLWMLLICYVMFVVFCFIASSCKSYLRYRLVPPR